LRAVSTDDFAGWLALQTNLALKGIVGINAMSKIAEVAGQEADAAYFKVWIGSSLRTSTVLLMTHTESR
jgi:hypothetical protein